MKKRALDTGPAAACRSPAVHHRLSSDSATGGYVADALKRKAAPAGASRRTGARAPVRHARGSAKGRATSGDGCSMLVFDHVEVHVPLFRLSVLPEELARRTTHRPLMLTSLISAATIARLLHGGEADVPAAPSSSASRRPLRAARRFPGVLALAKHEGGWHGMMDVVERSRGRLDWTLSDALFESLFSASEQRVLTDLGAGLAESVGFTGSYTRSFHIMISQPGSSCQPFHYDDDVSRFFVTCIVPLTPTTLESGRTEFADEKRPLLPQPGDVLVFDGRQYHRGTANVSDKLRAFAYVAYCSGADGNQGALKVHLEDKMQVVAATTTDEGVRVRQGHFYAFQGARANELWPARVEAIFREVGVSSEPFLTVRWLYGIEDAAPYRFRDPRERLWSAHLDQTPLRTVVRECSVALGVSKRDQKIRATADYYVDSCWDNGVARPMTRDDVAFAAQ